MQKPLLPLTSIINMSVGFLGIQTGFALQNANASRILQNLGAHTEELGWFWLVAPVTGMIVQPLIGHYSDRTWTSLGRRKPYFLVGAILASIGLMLMPNAALFSAFIPMLWVGAGMLMLMDASINVAMEPFRALVADKLSTDQRTAGFAVQTILIGLGAVIGSWLPQMLGMIGFATTTTDGSIPNNVIYSFVFGAAILMIAILWTIVTTKEYSPSEMNAFETEGSTVEETNGFLLKELSKDFVQMPKTMKQLGFVQFCSWFALFGMWVYTTPAIAEHVYKLAPNTTDSPLFQEAGNKVGVAFGFYNLVSVVFAFLIPYISKKLTRRVTHAVALICGGIGLLSVYFITSVEQLNYSMIGIGIAWASILAMPYAILGGAIPARKMGVYMGIFNFFITIPQICNGLLGGVLLKYVYNGYSIYALALSGVLLFIGAIACFFVDDTDEKAKL